MNNIDSILKERGNNYGAFTGQAKLSQDLKGVMQKNERYDVLPEYMKEAFEMVQHKFARAINGDCMYKDNIVDCIGYLQLVLNELEKEND